MPLSKRVLLAVMAALFALASPAAADAVSPFDGSTPRITPIPLPAPAAVIGDDGARTLLAAVGRDDYRTIDVVTGRTTAVAPPSPGCPVALGSGGLASLCQPGYFDWTVYTRAVGDPAWSAPTVIPEALLGAAPDSLVLTGVGSVWLQFSISGYHYSGKTVAMRRDPPNASDLSDSLGANAIPDLDAAAGAQTLCAPLTRPRLSGGDVYEETGLYGRIDYADPWGADTVFAHGKATVRLHRCGTGRTITVCRSATCRGMQLAGHLLVWTDRGRAYYRNLRTGRTTRIRVPHRTVVPRLVGSRIVVIAGSAPGNIEIGLVHR